VGDGAATRLVFTTNDQLRQEVPDWATELNLWCLECGSTHGTAFIGPSNSMRVSTKDAVFAEHVLTRKLDRLDHDTCADWTVELIEEAGSDASEPRELHQNQTSLGSIKEPANRSISRLTAAFIITMIVSSA